MTCLIETARATFPRAKVGLSAVLPGRHNKNRINIDMYNKIMYAICNENGAQYVDLTSRFESSPGRPNRDLYKDEIHPNKKGVKQIVEGIDEVTVADTTDKDNTHKRAAPTITTNTNQWTAQNRTAINRRGYWHTQEGNTSHQYRHTPGGSTR